MPRKLRVSSEAATDIEHIQAWYSQPGAGAVAVRRVQAILAAIRRLRRHPCRYPRDDRLAGARRMVIEGHAVIYEVTPDTGRDATSGDVTLLRVFGPGQDCSNR